MGAKVALIGLAIFLASFVGCSVSFCGGVGMGMEGDLQAAETGGEFAGFFILLMFAGIIVSIVGIVMKVAGK